jgi:hypothetical protein
MSAGSLNGGNLNLNSLTVGGVSISGANSGTPVSSITAPGGTPIQGAVLLAGTGISSSGQTITFTGGSGISGLSTTPVTATTTANPVPLSATWATTGASGSAPTATFVGTAGGMALNLVTPPLGGGGITSVVGTAGEISPTTAVTSGAVTLGLVDTAVTGGVYASPASVTVDGKGRITAITAGTAGSQGIPTLTAGAGTTTAVSTAFTATFADNLAVGATPTASFTASTGAMALAIATPPFGGGSGITSLTGTGGTPTTGGTIAFTSSVTSGASTALSFVPSANGMVLSGTVASGTSSGLPYYSTNKSWATTGATDSITVTALPAGTYLPLVSWTDANTANTTQLLSAPVPTAGSTTLQIVATGSITAGTTYAYILFKLT